MIKFIINKIYKLYNSIIDNSGITIQTDFLFKKNIMIVNKLYISYPINLLR